MAEKKYWFKAKLYGWGWYPASWQGWIITGLYVGVVFLLVVHFEENIAPFLAWATVATGIFALISYKKGEKPHWRWGK